MALHRPEQIRASILWAGVKNLKEFGYPDVSVDNITTVPIYRKFFLSMLTDEGNRTTVASFEEQKALLIQEIRALDGREAE